MMKENLKLEEGVFVNGEIVELLKIYQLEGVRFLYRNYKKGQGSILNDASGLGKCHQTVAFLSAALLGEEEKCLIVCENERKLHHWMYHLHVIAHLDSAVVDGRDLQHHQISLVTIKNLCEFERSFMKETWTILILDESEAFHKRENAHLMSEKELASFRKIGYRTKIFLASINLMDYLPHFFSLVRHCNVPKMQSPYYQKLEEDLLSKPKIRFMDKLMIDNVCRDFYLRRYPKQFEKDLPLIDPKIFETNFRQWKKVNLESTQLTSTLSDETEILVIESALIKRNSSEIDFKFPSPEELPATPLAQQISEDLFEAELMTQTMSPLLFDTSDFDSNKTIINEQKHVEIEETPNSQGYEIFGQDLLNNSSNSSSQQTLIVTTSSGEISVASMPSTSKYNFNVDDILKQKVTSSSSSAEVVAKQEAQSSVIAISSESNEVVRSKEENRNVCFKDIMRLSPDLFADDSSNDHEKENSFRPAQKSVSTNFSTPITKLVYGNCTINDQDEVSSVDLFADSSAENQTKKKDNTFEITKNDEFPSKLRVNSDTEMSPIKQTDSDSMVVVEIDEDISIIEKKSSVPSTPRSRKDIDLKTPSTSSSRTSISPKGWLSKRDSSDSSSSTPRRHTKKWKKLDILFDKNQKTTPSKKQTSISPRNRRLHEKQARCYSRVLAKSDDEDDF